MNIHKLSFLLLLILSSINIHKSYGASDNSEIRAQYYGYSVEDTENIKDVDLLEINDEVKALLDQNIRPIKSKEKKVIALHAFLFNEQYTNIRYHFASTKTAQQTYDSKSGDCLSHAALFVAAARYLGLDAVFQTVHIPRRWEKQEKFLVVPGHLNVLVKLPFGDKATVEFAGITLDSDKLKSKKASDISVLSEYYNNKGSEALAENNYDLAIAYFEKSISTWKKSKSAWSNLGVTYKILGRYKDAENAYLKSLDIKPKDITVIHNLYALYQLTNQEEKSEKYFKRAERYAKKNPYSLYKLARINYTNGDFNRALHSLTKAIKLKDNDPAFHHTLAKVLYKLNKKQEAITAIEHARDAAQNVLERKRFQKKISGLL